MDNTEFIIAGKNYRVTCRDEFLVFMNAFRDDLAIAQQDIAPFDGGSSSWSNITLESFLEAMQACITDHALAGNEFEIFEGTNCWSAIAEALVMGQVYE